MAYLTKGQIHRRWDVSRTIIDQLISSGAMACSRNLTTGRPLVESSEVLRLLGPAPAKRPALKEAGKPESAVGVDVLQNRTIELESRLEALQADRDRWMKLYTTTTELLTDKLAKTEAAAEQTRQEALLAEAKRNQERAALATLANAFEAKMHRQQQDAAKATAEVVAAKRELHQSKLQFARLLEDMSQTEAELRRRLADVEAELKTELEAAEDDLAALRGDASKNITPGRKSWLRRLLGL